MHLAAARPHAGSPSCCIASPAQSCRQPAGSRPSGPVDVAVVTSDVARASGRSDARRPLGLNQWHRNGLALQLAADQFDAGSATSGAQGSARSGVKHPTGMFPGRPSLPRAASFKKSLSSVRSETAFRSRSLFACSLEPMAFTGSLLETLELLKLVGSHSAILLAPAIVCLLRDAHLADCINTRRSLPDKDINLPQLLSYFLWVPGIPRTDGGTRSNVVCSPSVVLRFLNMAVDQFSRGTPISQTPGRIRWPAHSLRRARSDQ
ncbi:hypothetical protein CLV78_11815 [Aliiruegeria haliotis]|uniref:Uncharacterized protein n=1 Tax=Aliiruegeria haliotis TaxID=1280846 RepID=A0A2T0RF52_9RHOB|nr:hypothetical protein CLV78_11815 [Aliiruegeria haliotis]